MSLAAMHAGRFIDHGLCAGYGPACLARRDRRASVSVKAERRAAVVVATDGRISYDEMQDAASLAADIMQDATVVALMSAPRESTFEQLELSAGSVIDAVRMRTESDSYITYEITGTTADAISIATDPKQGLCVSLDIDPVLCIVLGKGSAVGPDSDRHAAVALARQSAVIGVPSVSCCLASLREAAPWDPLLDTLWELLPAVRVALQSGGGYPAAANFPRARFPFPERGRCALGVEVPLHPSVSGTARSAGAGWWGPEGCWSLGEEVPPGLRSPVLPEPQEAQVLLRAAFADGDTFLNVSVPPRLPRSAQQQPMFAAARYGVIWHRDEVQRARGGSSADSQEDLSRYGATGRDLWGRSLPSQQLSGGASARMATGAFVPQDQTSAVMRRQPVAEGGPGRTGEAAGRERVISFAVGRGRTLSDPVLAGDVDALFAGRVAVTTAQTWPAGHPCSLTDAVLAAAIADDEETGLPMWMFVHPGPAPGGRGG